MENPEKMNNGIQKRGLEYGHVSDNVALGRRVLEGTFEASSENGSMDDDEAVGIATAEQLEHIIEFPSLTPPNIYLAPVGGSKTHFHSKD